MADAPFVESVLHPTDLSESSHEAFTHALAIALYRQASLTVLHVVPPGAAVDAWDGSPAVRATLERWGLLAPGSPRSAVYEKLSLVVTKINVRGTDPLKAILSTLEREPRDLIVLATEGRHGLPRWLKPSLAEGVARRSKTMSLFVPHAGRGFVSREDGSISIRRILLPIDHEPDPAAAIAYASRAAVMSREELVEIHLLRVGRDVDWPALQLPELHSIRWNRIHREGEVVDQIVRAATELPADLVVMGTEGAKGILGALGGSVTEQVVRRTRCPVLAVPAERP